MRPSDIHTAKDIEKKLKEFDRKYTLPGIALSSHRECLIEQIIDSIRRIKYILLIRKWDVTNININTGSSLFDPLKGAVWYINKGDLDEAYWLVFLATHFGKNKTTGWNLARNIYGAGNSKPYWTWKKITNDPDLFLTWLDENQNLITYAGKFGNHRKYESCNAYKSRGTGSALLSYINWIGPSLNHQQKFSEIQHEFGVTPRDFFHHLYESMDQVNSFGRTAKFDYLTMIGKLGLLNIEPGSCYLNGATGPLRGARLLFANDPMAKLSPQQLTPNLDALEKKLNLFFGMQVLEDSLCNWQKSPNNFQHFVG